MNHPSGINRRQFGFKSIGSAVAASAAAQNLWTQQGVWAQDSAAAIPRSANETIQLGVIGIGPRCTYDLKAMLPMSDVRCVAIADVQASRRNAGKQLVDMTYGNQDLKLYSDFRELLARPDIEAVLIATGDRWHAAASIMAAEAGKDVYSEKPCGITIHDCQKLADTMTKLKRVFQAGTQRRSVPNFQKAVEAVHSGRLGELQTMHASVYIPTLDNSWLPSQPLPPKTLWTGISGWALLPGVLTTKSIARASGAVSGTLIREPDCWIGALIPLIYVSGRIRRTIQCRYATFLVKKESSVSMRMAFDW